MLLHVTIKNIVLIQSLTLDFQKGFCVLTGETGAGKSILLDSLGLVLGNKASTRLIRSGEQQGTVVAAFDISRNDAVQQLLKQHAIISGDELLIKRVIFASGKSKAMINDEAVSTKLLQQIAPCLVEIHGQHDQKHLFEAQKHREMYDLFCGNMPLTAKLSKAYQQWREAEKAYHALIEQAEQARRDEDYLRHVCAELEALAPEVDEDVTLADKRQAMMSVSKVFDALDDISKQMTEKYDVMQAIYGAEKVIARLPASVDETLFAPTSEALARAQIELEEVFSSMDVIRSSIGFDERELAAIEERLFELRDMARKYHIPVSELPNYAKTVQDNIQTLDNAEAEIAKADTHRKELQATYHTLAKQLSDIRHEKAQHFSDAIEKELKPLKMENARFKVALTPLEESHWAEHGIEHVEFAVQTNQGSPFGPVKHIASGGEMSRFMVALKVVMAEKNIVPTMIFDEIDTGIGGATSDAVGRRLSMLAKNVQVMCVTHQPQVAGYGNGHFRIEKQLRDGKMSTSVRVIDMDEKIEELARMLAGEQITDAAREAAKKLINVA